MKLFALLFAALFGAAAVQAQEFPDKDPENILVMETRNGTVYIEMLPDVAPKHVEQIKTLTRSGYYDQSPFHRVIDGFMAQGGDKTGTGFGKSKLPDLAAEISDIPFDRGVVGMARAANLNSANSQFFIMLARNQGLDNKYTVWGRVLEGMEVVDQIKKAPFTERSGIVKDPDYLVRMQVLSDAQGG